MFTLVYRLYLTISSYFQRDYDVFLKNLHLSKRFVVMLQVK